MKQGFYKKIIACAMSFVVFFSCVSFKTVQAEDDLGLDLSPNDFNSSFLEYVKNKGLHTDLVSGQALGYIPLAFDLKKDYSNSNLLFGFRSEILPEEYTATKAGLVTDIKDQGNFGACWSFAGVSSLESAAIKNGLFEPNSLDFSEMHMVYNLNKNTALDNSREYDTPEGGNYAMVAAYCSRGDGVVLEENCPYDTNFDKSSDDHWEVLKKDFCEIESEKKVIYPREMIFIPDADLFDEVAKENHLELIKRLVMKYGSVASVLYFNPKFLSYDQKSYYSGSFNIFPANHGVSIVGWDDNYSKENFKLEPEHDGAFIIKNSWGTEVHDNGYFYLSYDDCYAGANSFVVTEVDQTQEKYMFDNIYQKDYLGMQWAYPTQSEEIIECKIFDLKTKQENLTDIGFYTANSDVECEFYLVKLDKGGRPISLSQKLGEKKYEFPGYHTFELPEAVTLKASEALDNNNNKKDKLSVDLNNPDDLEYDVTKSDGKFGIAIKIKLKNAEFGETVSIPIEIKSPEFFGTSKANGQPEENFVLKISQDGKVVSRIDMYENVETPWFSFAITNLNIKAFTEKI